MNLKMPFGLVVAAIAATIAFHPILQAKATEQKVVVVEIRKFKFMPAIVVASPGDVVVWRNLDIVPHTATSKDKTWESDAIKPGDEWKIMITEDMSIEYYCRFHPTMTAVLDINVD